MFYTVPESDVICEWTVMLGRDAPAGHVIEENDDAARYMLLRLKSDEAAPLILDRVKPIYPPIALAAHVYGDVAISVIVGGDGAVQNLNAISGPVMLRGAATEGMRQWKFKPLLVGERPVRYQINAKISFSESGRGRVEMEP